jgi:23S rRNA pseudouridine2605 synthase
MSAHSDDRNPSAERSPAPTGIRLQRFLAATGLGSRRKCEEYIVAGRVSIDGQVVRDLGTRVEPSRQEVRVDTELVRRDPPRYFLLNKPRGYLCTNNDPAGRPRAIDLLPAGKLRLFTVGRLDEGSEGLILLTNDGELAHRLAHPRFQVPRTYGVQVAGRPTPRIFAALKEGLYFHEGRFHVHWVRRVGTKGNSTFLEVGLSHGQNREIRRLFARVGHKVMRLRRVAFGPLRLGRLGEGHFRPLTSSELSEIRDLASGKTRSGRPKSSDKRTKAPRAPARSVSDRAEPPPPPTEERPAVRKRTAHRRPERPTAREASRSGREESLSGSRQRNQHRAGASRNAEGRGRRPAETRSLGQGSHGNGNRKRRRKDA